MTLSKKLTRLALLCLAAPLLASCQSQPKAHSSAIERTAAEIEAEVTDRICLALRPQLVLRADYDASPEDVRSALAGNAAAWYCACREVCVVP